MEVLMPSNGQRFLIDECDEHATLSVWHINTYGYAANKKLGLLHRYLMGLKKGDKRQVDHINGNRLDCRRSNMRICTQSENQRNKKSPFNKTGFRGVQTCRGKFRAKIELNNKKICLGSYHTAIEAAHAYDEAALKYHGEFARLNFPDLRS